MNTTSTRTGEIGKVVLGCGIVAVVGMLICGGLAAYLVPKMMDKGMAMLERELERQQLLEDWTPPAEDATSEELLPEQVGSYTRSAAPNETTIADLNVEKTFHHAAYTAGTEEYTVYIDQASADERTLVFGQLKDKLDAHEGGSKFTLGTENSNSFFYQYDPPGVAGTAYYGKGWLILTTTNGEGENLNTFTEAFLDAIEGEPVVPVEEVKPPVGESETIPDSNPEEKSVTEPATDSPVE